MTAKNANIFGMTGAVLLFAGLVVQFMKLDFAFCNSPSAPSATFRCNVIDYDGSHDVVMAS